MPMVSAVIIFVLYYIIMVMGEKFAKEGVMTPIVGTWLASFIMIPLGAFLTYKASIDSNLFNVDAYIKFFIKIKNIFKKEGK